MSSWKWLLLILGTVLITAGGRTAPAQSAGGAGVIQGNVKSADGGPMEGVLSRHAPRARASPHPCSPIARATMHFPRLTPASTGCGRRPLASRQPDPNSP